MPVDWSKVWGPNTSAYSGGCPGSCYNFTADPTGSAGNVLTDFGGTVSTLGQAVSGFASVLQEKIAAQSITASYTSATTYQLAVRITPKTSAIVTLQFTTSGGNYPVTASYQLGASSGTAKFVELDQMLSWLAIKLV